MMAKGQQAYGPAALENPLSFEDASLHRNFACGRYLMCLELVIRRKWASFTCQGCSLALPLAQRMRRSRPAKVLYLPSATQA